MNPLIPVFRIAALASRVFDFSERLASIRSTTKALENVADIEIKIQHNSHALAEALEEYIRVRHKLSVEQAVARTARDIAFWMYEGYSKVIPSEQKIMSDVDKVGWRLRVGIKAKELAAKRMGGLSDVWGSVRWRGGASGTAPIYGILRMVRIGKRGRRISGGRRGTGGTAVSAAEGKLLDKTQGSSHGRMSRRAVEMFFETMLRVRGRGSLRVAFLFKRLKSIAKRGFIEVKNPKAEFPLQGNVDFTSSERTTQMRMRSFVEGADKFPGVLNMSIVLATKNLLEYLRTHSRDELSQLIDAKLVKSGMRSI